MYSQDNIMGQDARRVKGPRVEEGAGKGAAGLLTLEIPILIGFGLRFQLHFGVKLRLRLRG